MAWLSLNYSSVQGKTFKVSFKHCVAVIAVALMLFGSLLASAITLKIGDAYYLGYIDNGVPPSESNQLTWLTQMIGMSLNTTQASTNPVGEQIYRSSNNFGSLDVPTFEYKIEIPEVDPIPYTKFENTGFYYVLGKYGNNPKPAYGGSGNISHVWVIRDLQEEMLQVQPGKKDNDGGIPLSHITLFGPMPDIPMTVPDAGSTLCLLALSAAGIAAIRRKSLNR